MELLSHNDYLAALQRFEEIFQAKEGTKESEEANTLAALIQDYEKQVF